MIKNYLLLILCVFFPLKSFGENLKWFDLEKFERYQLKQELKIADGLEFKVGDKLIFLISLEEEFRPFIFKCIMLIVKIQN